MIADADMQTLTAAFASLPSGMDYMGAFPALELGPEGRVAFVPPTMDMTHTTSRVPKLTGSLADAHYSLIAQAQDAKDQNRPSSLAWMRDVDIGSTVALTSWLPPPSNILVSGGTSRSARCRARRYRAPRSRTPRATVSGPSASSTGRRRRSRCRPVAGSAAGRDAGVRGVGPEDSGRRRRQLQARRRARPDHRRSPRTSSPSPAEAPCARRSPRADRCFVFSPAGCSPSAACGGGNPLPAPPAAPRIIPGGGIADGPIRGALNVFVIDEDTRDVLSSAAVRVGAADEPAPCAGADRFDRPRAVRVERVRSAGPPTAGWGRQGASCSPSP